MKRPIFGMLIFILLTASPLSAKELGRIKVLTYNVFGVFVAPAREARMEQIGKEIAKLNPDIIGFQEAFNRKQRALILADLEKNGWGKPYEFYEKRWYGPGAWIVSKYPLEKTKMFTYPVNGTPVDSDWYAQKGVAYARIATPFGPLDFFDTHMIARYTSVKDRRGNIIEDDRSKTDRLLQAEFQAQVVQATNQAGRVRGLVSVGDFNSPPVLLEYHLFAALSALNNVGYELPISDCNGETVDCKPDNRIDHIFYQNYAGDSGFYLKPLKAEMVFSEKVKSRMGMVRMSDHNGLLVEFAALSADDAQAKVGDRSAAKIELASKNISNDLPRLKTEVDKKELNPSDPAGQAWAVQELVKLNAEKNRKNKIPTACAKIIIAGPQRKADLTESDFEQLQKAFNTK